MASYTLPTLPADTKIVVWFSCGAASAVAAKLTLEAYPHCRIRIVNNPIVEEDEDNRRFLKDVETWLDTPIELFTNPNFPTASAEDIWIKRKAMSFPHGAPCTQHAKKEARQIWESTERPEWHVLGFTYDEAARYDRFTLTERSNVLPILLAAECTKDDCALLLQEAGLDLPRVYALGYPNANCIGCSKATSPTYWNHVRKTHPAIFERRARLSRQLGVKLVRYKGKRIYLDELPPDAMGRPLKALPSVECGIFCEERP